MEPRLPGIMIFLDAHVHLYPRYDRDLLFDTLVTRARRLAPQAGQLALLMMLREGQRTLAEVLRAAERPRARWQVRDEPAPGVCIVAGEATRIHLFAARQVAVRERIELLGLFTEAAIPDGLAADETLDRLRGVGALPVLAWGLGKWLFTRAPVVHELIESATPKQPLLIGDTALRPSFWGEPRLMALARRRGLRVIHGSDPLPRAGDERVVGSYASLVEGFCSDQQPAADLRRLLLDPAVPLRAVGRRAGCLATIARLR
jgi:hypothetical protein